MSYTDEFIQSILPLAVKTQRETALPSVIMIAQAALETGYGKNILKDSRSGKSSYNLFNIKGEGPAGSILVSTLEYHGEKLIKVDSYFRAYHSYQESFNDYASFILRTSRYEPAVAVANSPEKYAGKLQECGYATDPKYAEKLLNIVKERSLFARVEEELKTQELVENETPSDWAQKSVEKAIKSGIMIGYGDGIWHPKAPVTREMLAVILDRLGFLEKN